MNIKTHLKTFETNVALWTETDPKQGCLLPYHDPSSLVFCTTSKGEQNLKGKRGLFHPDSGAKLEADQWFSRLSLRGIRVLYLYGVGLGYDYLAAKKWLKNNKERRLVFLEDNLSVLYRLFETDLGTELLKNDQVQLIYFDGLDDEEAKLEVLYWNYALKKMGISALRHYAQEKTELFEDLRHKLAYDNAVKNALVEEYLRYSVPFFKNFYPNLLELPNSYLGTKFFGKYKNTPAIICGAGPSLAKQIGLLKHLDSHALIFAGGSALNALTAHGYIPQIGAGIDPNPAQHERLSNNRGFEVPFFYRNRMYHQAFQEIHGPRLYIPGTGGYDLSEWFEEKFGITEEFLDEGHNVVNFSLQLAHAMGCNPIIFVGVDLGYTEMHAYSPGVVEETAVQLEDIIKTEDIDHTAILKKDIYGKPLYTLWKWVAESEWISTFAKEHPNVRLINATEGGLGFPDVPNRPLDQVAKEFLKDPCSFRDRFHADTMNSSMPQVTFEKVVSAVQEMVQSLYQCIDHFQTLIDENEQIRETILNTQKIPPTQQSGLAVLAETELEEEPAFQYILEIFNQVLVRLQSRELQELRTGKKRTPPWKKQALKLALNTKKFTFLRNVAEVNIELIRDAFRQKGVAT